MSDARVRLEPAIMLHLPEKSVLLLVEGRDVGLQFFQTLVIDAPSVDEAILIVRGHFARNDIEFVEIDPEETAFVAMREISFPPGDLASGILAASGRIYVDPTLSRFPMWQRFVNLLHNTFRKR